MTKKIEILVVVIILFVLAFVFGCKDKAEEHDIYGFIEWDCSCGEHLGGTYIKPYYWFKCATCGDIFTNTGCKTAKEYYELVGAGWLNDEVSEPDEPKKSYTAKELDEIYKDEPALGKLAKELWRVGEPED